MYQKILFSFSRSSFRVLFDIFELALAFRYIQIKNTITQFCKD